MSNIKIALAIRGHIRNSFSNNRMKNFCEYLCELYNIDIYIHSWQFFEAENSHRPGELLKKQQTETVQRKTFYEYFHDCSNNIKNILIEDDTSIKHIGRTVGKVCESSCPRICWKNYWYGKFRLLESIKNSKTEYDLVINIRIDNFVNKYSKKSNILETIIYDKIVECGKNIKNGPLKKLYFFSNKAMFGIDNCYMGPVSVMHRITKYFHEDLDKITEKYKGRRVTSQEWLVLFEANTVNEKLDTSIILPHVIKKRKNKEIQKMIQDRNRKRKLYNQDLRKKARLIQRQRKMLDNKTREILLDRMKRRKDARRNRILALREAAKEARLRRAERLKNND